MFTKQHYQTIAQAMQEAWDTTLDRDGDHVPYEDGIAVVQGIIARMFQRDSGAFDQERWLRAATPGNKVTAR